ncbi:CAMK family protein kinase [Reticulomyxa filosa]|uniref:CAMK family protein kinase n=1 Tax=Reticulomyxa filosa TaxID=46433 RepID=X6NIU3_RETFI|nr:CAMK family protein kinase [Reticulomyxa filosa]|eukprot:ETO25876.1 CAMK family protein kinase [Reticulomyxa filosa]
MNIALNGETLRKADSWRIGVLLYALVTGTLPYLASTQQNSFTQILAQKPIIPIEEIKCSSELKQLISKLLEPTYFKRVDVQTALKETWLKNAPSDLLPAEVFAKVQHFDRIEETKINSLKKKRGSFQNVVFAKKLSKAAKKSHWTWEEFETHYQKLDITNDIITLLTNAIFRGLDLEGTGMVQSALLLALFEDINLRMKPVIDKIKSQPEMSFEEVHEGLSKAIKEGFDISELLPVDNVIRSTDAKK